MSSTKCNGSVRADLVGGTLDLYPINLILKEAYTLNVALSLKSSCEVKPLGKPALKIHSKNYQTSLNIKLNELSLDHFFKDGFFSQEKYGKLTFVAYIIAQFKHPEGLHISLASDAPAGSGLGGSSSLGVTIYKTLCKYYKLNVSDEEIISRVRDIESLILNQGIPGYQDYYPALKGGVLALIPSSSKIESEQLFSDDLKQFLEKRMSLVYSNKSRLSGINNWKVYKDFFDGDHKVRKAFSQIAHLSSATYKALKEKNYQEVLNNILREGRLRKEIFLGFQTEEMNNFESRLHSLNPTSGLKVCGAGGGGCFLVIHENKQEVASICKELSVELLDFCIEKPLSY